MSLAAIGADDWNTPGQSGGGPTNWSVGATNTLVTGGTYGFNVDQQQAGGSIDHVNTFGTSTPFNSTGGSTTTFTNATQIDPALGHAVVFIPASSPMHNAGVGGIVDIGANILYAYDSSGNLTGSKLWDSATGQFSSAFIGAIVAGLNDSDSLVDLKSRLHPNIIQADWPAGY
jgi:hypothetical protein